MDRITSNYPKTSVNCDAVTLLTLFSTMRYPKNGRKFVFYHYTSKWDKGKRADCISLYLLSMTGILFVKMMTKGVLYENEFQGEDGLAVVGGKGSASVIF